MKGNREEEKDRSTRTEEGGSLFSNHQLYSGTVQKVLLHGCIHFLLTIFNGEAGMWMQAAWVTPVNKLRIIMNYFDAGIERSDIDVSRLIEKIKKKNKKKTNRNSHSRDNDDDKTAST